MRNDFEEFNKLKKCENRKGKREFHSREFHARENFVQVKIEKKKKKKTEMEHFGHIFL